MRSQTSLNILLQLLVIAAYMSSVGVALALISGSHIGSFISSPRNRNVKTQFPLQMSTTPLGLGEYAVTLSKPLGIILEECEAGNSAGGVQIASFAEGGAAAQFNENAMRNKMIVRGDRLVQIGTEDVSSTDFDSVMDMLIAAPTDQELCLTLSDGLGRMDIAPNLAKTLEAQDAIFVDEVVRAAVREIRCGDSPQAQSLGDLLKVEIVIGAGVRTVNKGKNDESRRCQVRFFAIFSRDTVTTFSCSVSATGIKRGKVEDGDQSVNIVALSCAKDEGWGQTVDLIVESTK